MFAFERRWAAAVMGGFAPPGGEGLAPTAGEVDWAESVERFLERANVKGRLGVRLGLLIAVTAPLWLWGRVRSAASLPGEERARLLDALLSHRVYAVRELALLLKLVACMALFRVPAMRERTGYDPVSVGGASGMRALTVLSAREVA